VSQSDFQLSLPGVPRGRSQAEMSHFEASGPQAPVESPLEARQQRLQQNRAAVRENENIRMSDWQKGVSLSTSRFGLQHSTEGDVPRWANFRESSKYGWRQHGRVQEVPVIGAHTPQEAVGPARFEQARSDPATRAHPRFQGMAGDMPRVFHKETEQGDEYHIVDGNHRITSAISQGQMLQPARVVGYPQREGMRAAQERLHEHQAAADTANVMRFEQQHGVQRVSDFDQSDTGHDMFGASFEHDPSFHDSWR
jgi:hypothetical protein